MLFTMFLERDYAEKTMNTEVPKNKEYQTVRLFATLGILTLIAVLLFKVVLFGPIRGNHTRSPAEIISQEKINP